MGKLLLALYFLVFSFTSFSQDDFDCYNYNETECQKCLQSKNEKLFKNKVKVCSKYKILNNLDTILFAVNSYDLNGDVINSRYYYEGQLKEEEIYKYGSNNELLEMSTVTYDKKVLENEDNCYNHSSNKIKYKYDKAGNKIEMKYFYPSTHKSYKVKFRYDKNGNCLEVKNKTITPTNTEKYIYDSLGLVISFSDFHGKKEYITEYKYDSLKNCIQQKHRYSEGQFSVEKTTYKYTTSGKILYQIDFNIYNKYKQTYDFQFSDSGVVKIVTHYSIRGDVIENVDTYSYNSHGDLTENSNMYGLTIYEYNDKGLLIKKIDQKFDDVYIYKYEFY